MEQIPNENGKHSQETTESLVKTEAKDDKSELRKASRDILYAELNSLISRNRNSLPFLLEMIQEMQKLKSDSLREMGLVAIQKVIDNGEEDDFKESKDKLKEEILKNEPAPVDCKQEGQVVKRESDNHVKAESSPISNTRMKPQKRSNKRNRSPDSEGSDGNDSYDRETSGDSSSYEAEITPPKGKISTKTKAKLKSNNRKAKKCDLNDSYSDSDAENKEIDWTRDSSARGDGKTQTKSKIPAGRKMVRQEKQAFNKKSKKN